MSRSPHRATFSSAVTPCPRMSRASPHTLSDSSGLRLWGMDDDPASPSGNGSETSPISVRWRPLISVANFSSEAAISARVSTNSAWRSRCSTWLEAGAGFRPRRWQTRASTDGGTVAWVPTGPDSLPKATPSRALSRRSEWRRISSNQTASLSPKVIGSACTPWVRPIISVSLCSIARAAEGVDQVVYLLRQKVGGVDELQAGRRVPHVARREAEMQPARLGAQGLAHGPQERRHVVARARNLLGDAVYVEGGPPQLDEVVLGDDAFLGPRLAGRKLDQQPLAVLAFVRPDALHSRSGVPFDHVRPGSWKMFGRGACAARPETILGML